MLRAAHTTWKTDTGRQRRDNEDSALARAPLFVIADGMGGAQAGEVASKLAVEAFQGELPETGSTEERLADRAQDANRKIYEMSRTEPGRAGMGTTLTAVFIDDTELAVAHVGDSRAYLFRHGELGRLTEDHTLVEALVRSGKLTEEEAAEHPQRSIITRALGVDPEVKVDTRSYAGRAGDVVLMCSDGLTSMISEDEIVSVLDSEPDLDRAAERLIAAANDAGGRDNITVILFSLEDVGGSATADHPTEVGLTPVVSPGTGDVAGGGSDTSSASPGPTSSRGPSATMTASRTEPSPDLAPKPPAPPARSQGRKGVAPSQARPRTAPVRAHSRRPADRGDRARPGRRWWLPGHPAAVLHRHQQPGIGHDLPRTSLRPAPGRCPL